MARKIEVTKEKMLQTAYQMIYDQGIMCFSKYGIDLNADKQSPASKA